MCCWIEVQSWAELSWLGKVVSEVQVRVESATAVSLFQLGLCSRKQQMMVFVMKSFLEWVNLKRYRNLPVVGKTLKQTALFLVVCCWYDESPVPLLLNCFLGLILFVFSVKHEAGRVTGLTSPTSADQRHLQHSVLWWDGKHYAHRGTEGERAALWWTG